uniref:Uncharacterized protein n=1 Tax=Salmonella enterica VII TaxID=59208 RepID=F2Q8R9_SALEE|nr:hypothetical protein S16_0066 [Salmonella enterica subsp. VII]
MATQSAGCGAAKSPVDVLNPYSGGVSDARFNGRWRDFFNPFFWCYLRSYFNSNPGNKVCFRHLSVTQKSCVQKRELPGRPWFYYWTG